jgi:Mg2+-importing ATPase
LPVLWHQLRSPLLGLLLTAAVASYFVGERSAALIIGVIVALSVGLGFVNEYRAEKAAEALHDQIHHETLVIRDGKPSMVDGTALVPGDVVELHLGDIVPADVRLLEVTGLECDESVLTGESLPVDKTTDPVPAGTPLAELSGCALMDTVVNAAGGRGIIVATGARTEFGKIAAGLSTHQPATHPQRLDRAEAGRRAAGRGHLARPPGSPRRDPQQRRAPRSSRTGCAATGPRNCSTPPAR